MAAFYEIGFFGGLVATTLFIIWAIKAYRSGKGSWGKRDHERCKKENEELQKWIEEQREEFRKRGEDCYF